MLRTLAIRDLAIIDSLDLEFGPGLNVLTGETGAGKSIIVGALNLLLGERADPDMLRAGAARGSVRGIFDVQREPAFLEFLEERGYAADEGELLVERQIQSSGKSIARINGYPTTVAALREVGEWLVDLHGQHEHQSLLSALKQRELLDAWGGTELAEVAGRVAALWDEMAALRSRIEDQVGAADRRDREIELLRFQLDDIRSAAPRPGEDVELQDELLRLRNVERLRESVTEALQRLKAAGGVLDTLALAERDVSDAAEMDPRLSPIAEALQAMRFDLEEHGRTLGSYLDSLDADPGRLEAVEERLARLSELKRKYGSTIEAVLAYADKAAETLQDLEQASYSLETWQADLARLQQEFHQACAELSRLRRLAAERFAELVNSEMAEVALERARLEVEVREIEPGRQGAEEIEFLISANPGEPLRPLSRVASGGELSRIMLAIKTAAALRSPLPTMVFDEIDVGIGGRTADAVGRKLSRMAQTAQVLCITHLAQIAANADSHFAIMKVEKDGRAVVRVRCLNLSERVDEIARMLAGDAVTDAVREHARLLLTQPRA